MKSLTLVLALFVSAGVSAQTYQVNTDESVVNWKGEKIVGNAHVGTLQFSEGSLKLKKGKIVSGTMVIDMTTIKESNNTAKLEGHLKSDDFFGVTKYPTATLEVKDSKKIKNYKNGGSSDLLVTADLTIKSTTQEVTFNASVAEDGDSIYGTAELIFDRSKFDVRYGSNSFFDNLADKAISDNITLSISLKASK